MKHYFLFTAIDLLVLLVYPIAYIAYHIQKQINTRSGRKMSRAY
jgi:hypothetical protein